MKCPYNITIATIQSRSYSFDENGNLTSEKLMENQRQQPTKCLESECAAFQNGKCCYKI
ncbi:MAG: hypothetical protein RR198_05100 [Oscillospiraceae bacterium]